MERLNEENLVYNVLRNDPTSLEMLTDVASLSLKKITEYRLLLAATSRCDRKLTYLLLRQNVPVAKPSGRLNLVNTALHYAVYPMQDVYITRILLTRGALPNALDSKGETPLHLAAQVHTVFVGVLLEFGAQVNARNACGETPLHLAARTKRTEIVRTLLKAGADARLVTEAGKTTLEYLLSESERSVWPPEDSNDAPEIARLLIQAGVDPNTRLSDSSTPLHLSCAQSRGKVVRVLLQYRGVEVNVEDARRRTPLYLAMTRRDASVVRLLLERGANPNICIDDETPLMMAVRSGSRKLVELLLKHRANPRYARSRDGVTPLHVAAIMSDGQIAGMLLLAGANAHVPSKDGVTPAMLAQRRVLDAQDDLERDDDNDCDGSEDGSSSTVTIKQRRVLGAHDELDCVDDDYDGSEDGSSSTVTIIQQRGDN